MALPAVPLPVKLFVSLFTNKEGLIKNALERLEQKYGKIDFLSKRMRFDNTSYYEKEFGKELFRKFVSFRDLMMPDVLPSVKLSTNMLEVECSDDRERREINIDPGYVSLEKVVLSSCKNFSHRLYLSEGVYGEVTLIYAKKRGFIPLDWTYPDYGSGGIMSILEDIRRRYKSQLKRLT